MPTTRRPLPVLDPGSLPPSSATPERDGADQAPCCDACAANERAAEGEPARGTPARAPGGPALGAPARVRISRDADRKVAFGGVAAAAGFLALALASLGLPEAARFGIWLPLHLALAGGAAVAISAVLPFFTAALAVAAPADPRLRAATVGAIAAGALLVSGGHVAGARVVAEAGGGLYLAGIIGLAVVAFRPLRRALGLRRRLVEVAYASAIASVAAGALLGTAFVSGAGAVLAGWDALKPAHGWLNLFGFVSLVIVATLIHLAPTVSGSRIRARRSATVAVAGLAIGTALVAAGYVVGLDAAARLGALLVIVGASAVAVHGISVRRDRGGWTSELAWHRLSEWSLLAAAGWFAVSAWVAAGRVLVLGAAPAAWRMDVFIVPLALGWIVQVLVGSWSHLLPAIGPGDAGRHTAQRRVLATWASARIVAWNSGVGALAVGLPLGSPPLIGIGATLVVVTGAAHLVLFGLAAFARPQVSGHGA